MWNSPDSLSKSGKRYSLADLSALVLPLDEILFQSKTTPVSDLGEEGILRRLERSELIFALYEVFEALTSDVAVPEGGHPGIHEAIIAELLSQSFDQVSCEIKMEDFGDSARMATWNSVDRLLVQRNPEEPSLPWMLEDAGMTLSDLQPFRSESSTMEHWNELLLGESSLLGEFLWDYDWRMDSLMDLRPTPRNW